MGRRKKERRKEGNGKKEMERRRSIDLGRGSAGGCGCAIFGARADMCLGILSLIKRDWLRAIGFAFPFSDEWKRSTDGL